ncbi:flagellar hook assembly protein FlgD [Flocculibacter collagenilyticus]|uniref:flagellar hook assembly protein FlgD n=1 Tax=Flocculibacter collagenilyticus TaxID=2744479 RepID=UPI0018F611D2|nr:flagellar hook assembly protein FlgD [Flocculibacter collagenilyticus]
MNSVSNNTSNYADGLRWEEKKVAEEERSQTLTQEDFFKLLTTQLAQQDPMKPTDNDQMIAQMTNFSMAEGISNMSDKFDEFVESSNSNKALQASSLVGQRVLISTPYGFKSGGEGLKGELDAPSGATDVILRIEDSKGQLMKSIPLGAHPAGKIPFEWDGIAENEQPVLDGIYKVKATGLVAGESVELPTQNYARVNSVTLGSGGQNMSLNLEGMNSISLDDVLALSD